MHKLTARGLKLTAPLAIAALLLGGCSEPATVDYFETLEEQEEAEQAYLQQFNSIRDSDSHWERFPRDDISDQQAVDQGYAACKYIADDPDPYGLDMAEEYLKTHGYSINAQEAIFELSQEYLCVDVADEAFEKLKQAEYGY